jgi:hypothetical protein
VGQSLQVHYSMYNLNILHPRAQKVLTEPTLSATHIQLMLECKSKREIYGRGEAYF